MQIQAEIKGLFFALWTQRRRAAKGLRATAELGWKERQQQLKTPLTQQERCCVWLQPFFLWKPERATENAVVFLLM